MENKKGLKMYIVFKTNDDGSITVMDSFNSRLAATKYGQKLYSDVRVLPKGIFSKKYPDDFEKYYN